MRDHAPWSMWLFFKPTGQPAPALLLIHVLNIMPLSTLADILRSFLWHHDESERGLHCCMSWMWHVLHGSDTFPISISRSEMPQAHVLTNNIIRHKKSRWFFICIVVGCLMALMVIFLLGSQHTSKPVDLVLKNMVQCVPGLKLSSIIDSSTLNSNDPGWISRHSR